ncbi:MAG: triose-phosphate isomerase [Candidatus Uhrbacteria bacterium]
MKAIVANWKMNLSVRESVALTRGILRGIRGQAILPEIVLCPSFVALSEMRKILARSRVRLGAQDVFWQDSGAFTGEVSVRQLKELNCSHVILGHSERRREFNETDQMVNKKVLAVLQAKMIPIVCVGESAQIRKKGQAAAVKAVQDQLAAVLEEARFSKTQPFFIAYEPIWAISTSLVKEAQPEQVVEMHRIIRGWLDEHYGHDLTNKVHILYGGSVDKESINSFLREPAIEGVLVGSASIKISELNSIVKQAINSLTQ